jgi:hypothetical protein
VVPTLRSLSSRTDSTLENSGENEIVGRTSDEAKEVPIERTIAPAIALVIIFFIKRVLVLIF